MIPTETTPRFEEFVYERPDLDQLEVDFSTQLAAFNEATSFPDQEATLQAIYRLRSHFETMYNIGQIRHTMDTRDAFYEAENNFFDENLPRFEQLKSNFYRALLAAKFREDLEEKYGQQLFDIAELSLRTFSPEIMPDLQKENQLISAYNKLKAKAQIEFQGETYNLSSILVKEMDADRDLRQAASEARWAWMAENSTELDRLFDELVAVRTKMARTLGFDSFVAMGYARMLRTDYSASDVARFRDQVAQHIVPIANRLYDRQRQRLAIEELRYYDEKYSFPEGNPTPRGNAEWIIEQAAGMYAELSPETDTFFQYMREHQLMDLVARDGKSTGGYCTFIPQYRAPFIFSNFNGTSGDIDVLTHEAGHAFQVYSSRDIAISEYNWPTYEACEIHSMSMEFFTWPWMKNFFLEDVERYRFAHLNAAINFLPYGVAVDEFQHYVYENSEASPAERNAAWSRIEEKYLPHRRYVGNTYLEGGGFWQRQTHIYAMPFYYIDYTLAQICAFQFWRRDQEDHQDAWADYVELCKAGGSRSFLNLVELANLESPFAPGCVEHVSSFVAKWLEEQAF